MLGWSCQSLKQQQLPLLAVQSMLCVALWEQVISVSHLDLPTGILSCRRKGLFLQTVPFPSSGEALIAKYVLAQNHSSL